MPGIWMTPATSERKARVPIAIRIPGARSAMWCSEPGKPMSVSSFSPVAGFLWSPWWRCPCSSSFASGQGSPVTTLKPIRNA